MNNQPVATRADRALRAGIAARMDAIQSLQEDVLLGQLSALTMADRTVLAARNGRFTDERKVEDNVTRLKALELALQLRNAFPAKQLEVTGQVRVEQLYELAVRMETLPIAQLRELAGVVDAVVVEGQARPVPQLLDPAQDAEGVDG